ncbi:tetratricopeptide repeat-containing sensor histidine kinase [Neotamlana laminarinivorans]|uniref:Tetratricopeptide repeat protein n=1 Tax=Neotamlana laminarinivorans TaxID=2883124 RepID=A0A9X1L173_9FLAO|nr:tetratricopeptide repeat protein [Tamlana laminarinivorans]MCB4798448.1 tetratricopeptide repeat protein [Tamlana laminarinivorans]
MKHIVLFSFILLAKTICAQSLSENTNIDNVQRLIFIGDSLKKTNKTEALNNFKKGLAIALDNKLNKEASILYKKIGVLHHVKREYEIAESYYKKGVLVDSVSSVTADLLYNISLLKSASNQQDSALYYIENSIEHYEHFKTQERALKAYLRAGILYKDNQLFDKALSYSIKAYNGFLEIENEEKLADVCTNLGNIENQLKNYHQALQYHQEALKLHVKTRNNSGKGRSYTNIGNVYSNIKVPDSTIVNYKRALTYFNQHSSNYAVLLNNLGRSHFELKDYKGAQTYFEQAIGLNKKLNNSSALMYNYNGIIDLFIKTNKLEKANMYLKKSQKLLSEIIDNNVLLNFYKNESEYHKKTNNYEKALKANQKYIELYEIVFNAENAKISQSLQAKFNYERKENEILKLKLVNAENQNLLEEKNKNIRDKNLTLLILAILLALLAVVYYLLLQRQKTKDQDVKIEKLEAIYNGQESIKKRIARDLHDIITTNFDGLRLRVLALKRADNVSEKVDSISTDLKKMNQQIRTVSHRLYPLEMYMGKQKFTDVIKSRLSEFQLYGKVFVELQKPLPELLNHLSLSVQNNFYGIILEVLNNVDKHAFAKKLTINNYIKTHNLHFTFQDNGIGITQNHKEGIGLMNIKQRVEILEGFCEIIKIETGTQVHIYFPLKN